MTIDEVIQRIGSIIEDFDPGSHANALRLARFLDVQARKLRDEVSDDMSSRTE